MRSDARRGATGRVRRGWGAAGLLLGLVLGATACSTTPPATGLRVVEPERPPPGPEEIAEAQRRLVSLGHYLGPVDGRLTAETRVALARFQRRAGLEVTGALDPETRQALERAAPPLEEEALPESPKELPSLPSAEALLAEEPHRPQPPPGWLEPVLEEAAAILEEGEAAARARLAVEGGSAADRALRMGEAEGRLAAARAAAFDAVVQARLRAGFAPLPEELDRALRQALQERDLLVRPERPGWGRDEYEAVRWLERSLGLPQTGLPSLPLLQALGIDPTSIFGRGGIGPGAENAVQSGP